MCTHNCFIVLLVIVSLCEARGNKTLKVYPVKCKNKWINKQSVVWRTDHINIKSCTLHNVLMKLSFVRCGGLRHKLALCTLTSFTLVLIVSYIPYSVWEECQHCELVTVQRTLGLPLPQSLPKAFDVRLLHCITKTWPRWLQRVLLPITVKDTLFFCFWQLLYTVPPQTFLPVDITSLRYQPQPPLTVEKTKTNCNIDH